MKLREAQQNQTLNTTSINKQLTSKSNKSLETDSKLSSALRLNEMSNSNSLSKLHKKVSFKD